MINLLFDDPWFDLALGTIAVLSVGCTIAAVAPKALASAALGNVMSAAIAVAIIVTAEPRSPARSLSSST